MTNPPIDKLVQQLLDIIPPSLSALSSELERQFYTILKTAFLKMDLVTREEFDVQVNVLKRTRRKLEELEKLLADSEKSTVFPETPSVLAKPKQAAHKKSALPKEADK